MVLWETQHWKGGRQKKRQLGQGDLQYHKYDTSTGNGSSSIKEVGTGGAEENCDSDIKESAGCSGGESCANGDGVAAEI